MEEKSLVIIGERYARVRRSNRVSTFGRAPIGGGVTLSVIAQCYQFARQSPTADARLMKQRLEEKHTPLRARCVWLSTTVDNNDRF